MNKRRQGGDDPFAENPLARTAGQIAALDRWVARVAPRLGITHWQIQISPHACDGDAWAEVHWLHFKDSAWLATSADFVEQTPELQREALLHEMLHIAVLRVRTLADKLIESELGERTEAVIADALLQVEELGVDRMARGLAPLFPVVDWSVA